MSLNLQRLDNEYFSEFYIQIRILKHFLWRDFLALLAIAIPDARYFSFKKSKTRATAHVFIVQTHPHH